MKTLSIPGGTASFREKHEIKIRHRRMIETATIAALPALSKLPDDEKALKNLNVLDLGLSGPEAESIFALEDALVLAILDSWTLDSPCPSNLEELGDLEPAVYDALKLALPELGVLVGDGFDPPDPHSKGFESSPTVPSDGSVASSRADQEFTSTGTSPNSGPSTASEPPSLGIPMSSS